MGSMNDIRIGTRMSLNHYKKSLVDFLDYLTRLDAMHLFILFLTADSISYGILNNIELQDLKYAIVSMVQYSVTL